MSKSFRVGIFVVLALLSLSAGIFLIGNKEFLFNPTYRLKADFQNVGGLDNGAEVRVGGIHEGTISRIDLPTEPGGKVTVEMKLHSSTQNIIRKDSIASIKTEGLLGDKYLEISFGTGKAQAVRNDDVIASEVATPGEFRSSSTPRSQLRRTSQIKLQWATERLTSSTFHALF